MNVLFCLDENYVQPLKVMLYSLMLRHEARSLDVYLMYTDFSPASLKELDRLLDHQGHRFHPVDCSDFLRDLEKENKDLKEAKVTRYYSLEMYLWLFAPYLLPEDVDRALYLDPDMVCLNPLDPLYYADFEEEWFKAASYDFKNNWIQFLNNLRLGNWTSEKYFNTGVVLMDLASLRRETSPQAVVEAVAAKEKVLYLPDQDIFNYLYEDKTGQVPWLYYNLDPRPFTVMARLFPEDYPPGWAAEHAVLIHYCGRHKPWLYRGKYRYDLGDYWFETEEKLLAYEDSSLRKLTHV